MRGVRFTKAELAVLREVDGILSDGFWDNPEEPSHGKSRTAWASVMQKLSEASAPQEPGVSAGAIERALVANSRGKVLALAGKPNWGMLSRRATAAGATVEDAEVVGTWMARQGWLPALTLDSVLNKWSSYLARARVEEPGDTGGRRDVGQATPRAGASTTGRRPAPGLR